MSLLRLIYLGLAIWGAAHSVYHLLPWIQAGEPGVAGLLEALRTNAAANALFREIVIAALALSVFVTAEVSVRRNWIGLAALPATAVFGVSCGLPLYLFLRTRPVG